MKATQSSLSNIGRFGASVVATLALGASSASALTSVTVPIGGKQIGNGIDLIADSGADRLDRATNYTFTVVGKCYGTPKVTATNPPSSLMDNKVPNPVSFKSLLNSFKSGSGNFLSGSYSNPTGTFPIFAIIHTYKRTITTPVGPASFGAKVVAGVKGKGTPALDGQAYFHITEVNIVPPFPTEIGTLKFTPGSALVITVAP